MNAFLTDDTKAIILLCGVFGKGRSEKPLTQAEYTSLVRWLISVGMRPGDLLSKNHGADVSAGVGIDRLRFESLLGRGVMLGFAVEEWQRNGIWIISRSDKEYPVRYKQHLKDDAPPILFGIGEKYLLAGGGVAIVGSRHVDMNGETFAKEVAELCARNRLPVISGGARGVDQFAMTSALEAGGKVIGVIAENLQRKSLEKNARYAIAEGRLLLISPYHPDAGFSVGTAMARNKMIYALADYGLVVSTDYKKGGTWAGAYEELKRENPRPIFVRTVKDAPSGNGKLVELGAHAWPQTDKEISLVEQLHGIGKSKSGLLPLQEELFPISSLVDEPDSGLQGSGINASS